MEQIREYNDYIQTTKSYLRKFKQFKATAENKREKVALLRDEMARADADINAPIAQYGEKMGTGHQELNGVEAKAARRESVYQMINTLEIEAGRLEHICNMVERSLEMLGTADRNLIEMHYFEGMSWRQVAAQEYLTEKWVSKKGAGVVREIAKMIFGSAVGEQQQLFVFAVG